MLNYRLFHLSVIVASYMLRFIPGTYRFIDQSTNGEKVGVMASVHCRRVGTLVPIALQVSQFSCISLHFFWATYLETDLIVVDIFDRFECRNRVATTYLLMR